MTNYEKIQKASPDHLIEILCGIGCDPCEGCVCGCDDNLRKGIEIYLQRDYDCNTSHVILSNKVCIDRLTVIRDRYANTLKNMSKRPDSDIVETHQAIEYAISLLEKLEE